MDTEMNNRLPNVAVAYPSSWHRLFAHIIDVLIVFIFWFIFMFLPAFALRETETGNKLIAPLLNLIFFGISWIYSVKFEVSRYRATPGKLLFKMQVNDASGKSIDFGQANIRFVAKVITSWVFFIGFLVVVFTEKKQGIHDKLANTFVTYKSDY